MKIGLNLIYGQCICLHKSLVGNIQHQSATLKDSWVVEKNKLHIKDENFGKYACMTIIIHNYAVQESVTIIHSI